MRSWIGLADGKAWRPAANDPLPPKEVKPDGTPAGEGHPDCKGL